MKNIEKRSRAQIFDYQQFLLLVNKIKQGQQESTQLLEKGCSNQQLFHQFKHMILTDQIEEIQEMCINKECKSQNRKTCLDCIIKIIHDNHEQSNINNNCNTHELIQIIQQYKTFINKQIDCLIYQFYFEQLELAGQKNGVEAFQKVQQLQTIEDQIKQSQNLIDQISILEYIQQQDKTNIGIYEYLLETQKKIQIIEQNIEDYIQFKNHIKNSQNIINRINSNDIIKFQDLKKRKHIIIKNIITTQFYKNGERDKDDNQTLSEQIKALYEEGQKLTQLNQNEQAIQHYDLYLSQNPNNSIACLWKGISCNNLKRYQEAIEMYNKAIQLNPNLSEAYNNKGNCLGKLKRYEEALEMYHRAIQINPQFSEAFNNMGNCLLNLKRYELAIQLYDDAIRLNPQQPKAYNNKGISFYHLRQYEQAIKMFDRAIKLNPQFSEPYNNRGTSLDELKRYDEAIQMYDKAIQLNPSYSEAYNNKGKSLINCNRYKEAEISFKKADELQSIG